MGTLIKTGALIQKNFWVCLALLSLSLTIVGAGRITIQLHQRQTNQTKLNAELKNWLNDLSEQGSLDDLSKKEKLQLFLNIQ